MRRPRAVLARARDGVRSRLWPLPVVAVVVSVVVGLLLPRFDARVDASVPTWLDGVLFGGDADAARTVLDAVSSSLITVTSLTFSLTVVTLQLASSQFSPRLLRTFASDVFVQATLGLFLATFTYSLTVLRAVRNADDGLPFVPRISVTVSFVLAVASVVGLVVFLAHLARQIRVETMLRQVHDDASSTVRGTLERSSRSPAAEVPSAADDAAPVFAPASGFVVRVDADDLLDLACRTDTVIALDVFPGVSVVRGVPMGRVWRPGAALDDDTVDRVRRGGGECVRTGYERTAVDDLGFGLRQLTDVANKALSPGINDPTTAVHALGHISALLCELAGLEPGTVVLRDADDVVRVVLRRPDIGELVEAAIGQVRRYGSSDPQVVDRLFGLLRELAWRVPPASAGVVTGQLERLQRTVDHSDFDAVERAELARSAHGVRDAITANATAAP